MGTLRTFEYFRPASIEEAGNGLNGNRTRPSPDAVVDLKAIRSLDHFSWTNGSGFGVDAMFTITSAVKNPEIHKRLGMLRTPALAIGHPRVQGDHE